MLFNSQSETEPLNLLIRQQFMHLQIKFLSFETAIATRLFHNQTAAHTPFLNQEPVTFSISAWDIMSAVVQNTLVRSCQQFVRERLRTSHLNATRQSFTFSRPLILKTPRTVSVLCPSRVTTALPHPTPRKLCLRTGKRSTYLVSPQRSCHQLPWCIHQMHIPLWNLPIVSFHCDFSDIFVALTNSNYIWETVTI